MCVSVYECRPSIVLNGSATVLLYYCTQEGGVSVLKPPEGRQRSSRGLQLSTLVLPGRALGTAGHHRSVVQLGFLSCRGAGMHIGIFLAFFKVDAHQEAETDQEPQAQRQDRERMSVRGFDEARVQQRRREAR